MSVADAFVDAVTDGSLLDGVKRDVPHAELIALGVGRLTLLRRGGR